jgi:hypothetical protein
VALANLAGMVVIVRVEGTSRDEAGLGKPRSHTTELRTVKQSSALAQQNLLLKSNCDDGQRR